jgi:hypothetical protein
MALSSGRIDLPIHIEETAPPGHADAVVDAFRQAGFDVEVQADYGRRSLGDLPWVVQVAVDGSLAGFFGALGVDAYNRFKALVHAIRHARAGAGSGEGEIDFADSDATHLIVGSQLRDEAMDALADADWSDLQGGWLVWRADRQEWIDHTRRDRP